MFGTFRVIHFYPGEQSHLYTAPELGPGLKRPEVTASPRDGESSTVHLHDCFRAVSSRACETPGHSTLHISS